MQAPVPSSALLRRRDRPSGSKVTNIELFFDLVFVFAITQLSHALLADLSPGGGLRTLVLFVAVWWVWIYTGWATNWLETSHSAVRLLLFLLMLAGIVMAVCTPHAFGAAGWGFALAVVLAQCGRSLFMIAAFRRASPAGMRNFQRILCWQALGGLFWLAGAALPDTRLMLWLVAIGLEFASPALSFFVPGLGRSHTTDWNVSGEHMAERTSLFVIIALGEALIMTCIAFERAGWSTEALLALLVSFTGSVAMWWIYFDTAVERGTRAISHAADPGRAARLCYTYLHLPIVAGVVLAAVGDELVLAHPSGQPDQAAVLVVAGAAVVFLVGNLLFKCTLAGRVPLSHLIGLGLVLVLAAAGPGLAPLLLSAAIAAALVLTAFWETTSLRASGTGRSQR